MPVFQTNSAGGERQQVIVGDVLERETRLIRGGKT